jgi:tetratricopeptide (TPR) repeat protein
VWLISGLVQLGRLEEARAHLRFLNRNAGMANSFEHAMIVWADAFVQNDLPRQAVALQEALEYSPGNNIIQVNLAWVRSQMGNIDGALEALESILQERWHYAPAYILAAECYVREKDFVRARQVLREALGVPPVEMSVYGMLAALTAAEGNDRDAERFERMFLSSAKDRGADSTGASQQLADYYRSYLKDDSTGTAAELVQKRLKLLLSP